MSPLVEFGSSVDPFSSPFGPKGPEILLISPGTDFIGAEPVEKLL